MGTTVGIKNLRDLTDAPNDITEVAALLTTNSNTTFGNGTTKTQITHSSDEAIQKRHQWKFYSNIDNSPVLIMGSENYPTLIIDSYSGTSWSSGGNFRGISVNGVREKPRLRFINCNYLYLPGIINSAFGGNLQELIVEASRCNFSWTGGPNTPMFGRDGIYDTCEFHGGSSAKIDGGNSLFILAPKVFTNILIKNWWNALKVEDDNFFYGSASFIDTTYDCFAWGRQGDGGPANRQVFSDSTINLVNSIFDKEKAKASESGSLSIWRTIKTSAKMPDGTGLAGTKIFTLNENVNREFSLVINVRSNGSGVYTGYDTPTTGRVSDAPTKELMYYFRVGDRVEISGYPENSPNNGIFNVIGKLENGIRYADSQALYTDNTADIEDTQDTLVTIKKLPSISDSLGEINEFAVQVAYARSQMLGNGAPDRSNTFTLTEMLNGVGSQTGYFERNNWKLAMIPVYPYKRLELDVVLESNTSDSGFAWNPLQFIDTAITERDGDVVQAYTIFENLNEIYDYAEWFKRQTGNEQYPRHDFGFCKKDGTVLDFGNLNIIIDQNATSIFSYDEILNRVILKSMTLNSGSTIKSIKTLGRITVLGSLVNVSYKDSTGIAIMITSNAENTRIAFKLDSSSTFMFGDTSNSLNRKTTVLKIPFEIVTIVAKAEGFDPVRITFDPSSTVTEINIILSKNQNVDLSQSLDGYFFDGEEKNFAINNTNISDPRAMYFHDNKIWIYDYNGTETPGIIKSYDTNGVLLLESIILDNVNNEEILDIAVDDTRRFHLSYRTIYVATHTNQITQQRLILDGLEFDRVVSITIIGNKLYILNSGTTPQTRKIFVIDITLNIVGFPRITSEEFILADENSNPQSITTDGVNLFVADVPSGTETHRMFAYDIAINGNGNEKNIPSRMFDIEPNNMDTKSMAYGDNTFWILDDNDNIIYSHRGTGEYHRINAIYFQYLQIKSIMYVGTTNLKNREALSKRIFDKIMTSNAGLQWCHANPNENITLGGFPYAIRSDRIVIDEELFKAEKILNTTLTEHSTFGYTIHEKDYITAYLPPINENGVVEINSLASNFVVSEGALNRVLQNTQTQQAFENSINSASNVIKILADTDNLKDHVQSRPTIPDITQYEHLGIIDWDGSGVTRTVNPQLPNDRVQSIIVNDDGKLEILFNTHDFSDFFIIDIALSDDVSIAYNLIGNERLYLETDATFVDATRPIDRFSIMPEVDLELAGTINGQPNQILERRPVVATVTLKERGLPKPFKFDMGKPPNAIITKISLNIKLPSSDTNQTKLILDNFRIFKSIQRDITDYRADVSQLETDVTKITKRLINRRKVNSETNKAEYYDDDKTTILSQSSLKDSDGEPSSSPIYDEVPD